NNSYQQLRVDVISGSYKPAAVRKVEIPKAQGGVRMLGIPTVVDRLIQQSVSQWLSRHYEKDFSSFSYGFRPNRNAHQAVLQAQSFLNEGKEYVIELDLEKFFDKVNHDKLMSLLERKVKDTGTLQLIHRYLQSGIMEDGVVSQRLEGTPQGSPLSPLLSNVMLDELDKELSKRGHSFVRYADDCKIYVRSMKSASRVLKSITKYIEENLKLVVNKTKSRISRPDVSSLLGFSFYKIKGQWLVQIGHKSIDKIKQKSKEITSRSNGANTIQKIQKINPVIVGWVNYFSIATSKPIMRQLDKLMRTRLRMGIWKEWKNNKTRVLNLLKLKVSRHKSYEWGNASKGYCRTAHSPILMTTLNNAYFTKQGYVGFENTYIKVTAEMQTTLF
ncbi:MAG TPA: group II intron reverse transcriptase/maturase, partial [Bacteroidales bacterium]